MERIVDTREAPERRDPLVLAGFRPKALACGDVLFGDVGGSSVLIENKKVSQFLQDASTGQLQSQLRRMCEEADHRVLMIEGSFQLDANGMVWKTGFSWDMARDMLLSAQHSGVMVDRSSDAHDTVRRILHLADHYYKKESHSFQKAHYSGDAWVTVLTQADGIGSKTARMLLEHQGSLGAVVTATEADLLEIPGIGPKTARTLWRFWRERGNGR
jgi:ERCC4-type nuclease